MLNVFKRKRSKFFGKIAIEKGLATKEDIREALKIQKEYLEKRNFHKKIGAILAERGILTHDDIRVILEEQERQNSLMAWFYAFFHMSR